MYIEIPENATNGDVIKILFPEMLPKVDHWNCTYYVFSQEWFNAQYRLSMCKSCIHHGFDANGYTICNSPNQVHHEGSGICPDYVERMAHWVIDKHEYFSFGSYFKINCHCSKCGQTVEFVESKQDTNRKQLSILINDKPEVRVFFNIDNFCRCCGADMQVIES